MKEWILFIDLGLIFRFIVHLLNFKDMLCPGWGGRCAKALLFIDVLYLYFFYSVEAEIPALFLFVISDPLINLSGIYRSIVHCSIRQMDGSLFQLFYQMFEASKWDREEVLCMESSAVRNVVAILKITRWRVLYVGAEYLYVYHAGMGWEGS